MRYDVVCIGSGLGGFTAAVRAARAGARVALVEKDDLGGSCLKNRLVPALLLSATAGLHRDFRDAPLGRGTSKCVIDLTAVENRKEKLWQELQNRLYALLERNRIDFYPGFGFVYTNTTVLVKQNGNELYLDTANIILACGSTPAAYIKETGERLAFISPEEAYALTDLPESMLVLGGNAEACSLASTFAELGVAVTLAVPGEFLPGMDRDLVTEMSDILLRQGVTILEGTVLREVRHCPGGWRCCLGEGINMMVTKIVNAHERWPRTTGMGLEALGITLGRRGEVLVNDRMETSVPGIYAVGEVTGTTVGAQGAAYQGEVAADHILGVPGYFDPDIVPLYLFTIPPAGSIGLTTEQAQARGYNVCTGKFAFRDTLGGCLRGHDDGLVKVVADHLTGRILGVHIIGRSASELLVNASLAVHLQVPVEKAYTGAGLVRGTMSEALMEAIADVRGQSIMV
ncbi:MAG: NAD(P)/FAD-dependent oxidoreductase [Peptococcaceae bacterium]|nr:NAD(P)/FAD-dependent oxidoreductase [Peptococcaceae bacterium]